MAGHASGHDRLHRRAGGVPEPARADPGAGNRAAELAWRDARLSHSGNGIYGEMYVAAMVALAFTTEDVREVVEGASRVVPPGSRLARAIELARSLPSRTAALLYGGGDFGRTISLAVMGGWDSDCNGASAGSILGVLHGRPAIPDAWAGPLNGTVRSSLKGFDRSKIDDLAERTLAQVPARYLQ